MAQGQLTLSEREWIAMAHANGRGQAQIARRLGRAPGTISRELQRNTGTLGRNGLGSIKGYLAGEADRKAKARRRAANAARAKLTDPALGARVREGLEKFWSPQQISERMKLEHPEDPRARISPESVYRWVYAEAQAGGSYHRFLRQARRRRRPRTGRKTRQKEPFRGAVRIDQRPAVVAERSRVGDWESDTVVGKRPGRAVLATHLERRSRFVLIRKLPNAKARTFNRASVEAFASVPAEHRLTLTADNGSEFARFQRLQKKLSLSVFFAEPYKAYQRGANENANGLIRQFFPKGTDLAKVRPAEVAKVQELMNNRPRKRLAYRTPAEVFRPPPGVALRA
jgi:transposase, IS30 family